jgi:hypothetical protein
VKKTTLARHRLVNTALKTEIAAIHAWTAKCYTPEEWTKLQEERKSLGNEAEGIREEGIGKASPE